MIRAAAMSLFASHFVTGGLMAAPAPGVEWDWQLSGTISLPRIAVFDTDPDSVTAQQIAALKAAQTYTICYVSVGTLENWRSDVVGFPADVIGTRYDGWPGEWFLDIRQTDTLVPLMEARFQRCLDMGFDAVEADNIDLHDRATGFSITKADSIRYVSILAHMAHEMGIEIGQKNAPELTPQLVDLMDFAITESCFQDGWCDQITAYTAQDKPVFDVEYTDRELNFKSACREATALGISLIAKDRDLTAERRACP